MNRRRFLQCVALVPIAAAIPAVISTQAIAGVDIARSELDKIEVHWFNMTATGDGWRQTMCGYFRDLSDAQRHFSPMPGAHTVGWSRTVSKLVPAPAEPA